MLPEISLNVLDIAQNSIKAGASLVEIKVSIMREEHLLTLSIEDDGCGMDAEQLERVIDPFFTSRSTRKIGLGVPFLKQAAEASGGNFRISSEVNVGTCVSATFHTDNIDCMPLGDINSTIFSLVTTNEELNFVYTYRVNEKEFTLDTREIREILGDVSFQNGEVSSFLREYLSENQLEVEQQ
ncbi:MAG: sensor histidine kinase [Lachnospiraceae bacterium]|nr:sensor histidine kinase [Parasporobacterium sp.]MBR4169308.1 sensor histidine kinase [Lachnospiraceae bacterium]